MCPTNDDVEDTEHVLLLYPSFEVPHRVLLAGVSACIVIKILLMVSIKIYFC